MGIKYVLSVKAKIDCPELTYRGECDTPDGPAGLYRPGFEENQRYYSEVGPTYVYELTDPLGVAFLVNEAKVVTHAEALTGIFRRTGEPWMNGVVEVQGAGPAAASRPATTRADDGGLAPAARIVAEGYNHTRIGVTTPAARHLVLSYLHRPWWRATIDGRSTPIRRAYGGFMSVAVPAGRHTAQFRYHPVDVHAGIILSALALVLAASATFMPRRRPAAGPTLSK